MIAWEMDVRTRRFLRVSGAAESVLGYPEKRWREAPGFWIGVLHPDDRERIARAMWRVAREGGACEIEYRVIAADGTVVRLRDRVRVVQGNGGEASVLQGATVDVTPEPSRVADFEDERPRRWRRSRRTNHILSSPVLTTRPAAPFVMPAPPPPPAEPRVERVEHVERVERVERVEPVEPVRRPERTSVFARERLLDELGEAVLASDASHRIVYWNKAAEALLGWAAEEATGRTDSELLQAKTTAGQTAEIIAGLLGQRPWSAEVMVRTRDRSAIPARITATALRGADGAVAGYVAVVTDLRTVRERASRREAAVAMEAVAKLARGIALELNASVARIEGAIRNVLAHVSLRDPARNQLDDALRMVDQTAALAGQLLAVGRETAVKPVATDLSNVVRSSQAALSLLCGAGIALEFELDPELPPAWVDPAAASQVLLNLAASSCSAMPQGGRLVIATYALDLLRPQELESDAPTGQWIVLEVRDTRAEVPRPIERIFEPFSAGAEGASASGMGLAAAHGLVAVSGGRLTAEVCAPEGVRFRALFRPAAAAPGFPRGA